MKADTNLIECGNGIKPSVNIIVYIPVQISLPSNGEWVEYPPAFRKGHINLGLSIRTQILCRNRFIGGWQCCIQLVYLFQKCLPFSHDPILLIQSQSFCCFWTNRWK